MVQFNADYFYCHVEPTVIFGNSCGDKTMGACHYTPSAVTGMPLQMHQPIQCSDGTHPDDPTQVTTGTPAEANLESCSLEMRRDYTTAPFYLRPTQAVAHPIQLFPPQANDPNVMVIATWATK